ncbi:uncharacterized protein LOC119308800 isoform X2 [Triticum dicoccoides]|uniref:uncharacterized protein LOC119308800 isoform X2 n=1 Tax=Triticum dicoccoides TaxID=85692 RepID=UPI001890BF4C|nr:uncharacterized protein LOC119308800 isoform X2 [Triticum dicoccoides]
MGAATQFSSGQRRLAIWIRHVVPAVGAASPAASWAEEGAQLLLGRRREVGCFLGRGGSSAASWAEEGARSICSPSRPDPWGTCPRFNARPTLSPRVICIGFRKQSI